MVETRDIKDNDSLKKWLAEWPAENGLDDKATRAIAVAIAHRAAMRVLPVWWKSCLLSDAHRPELTALPVLRVNLIIGVAAQMPTPMIKKAAATAASSATFHATAASASYAVAAIAATSYATIAHTAAGATSFATGTFSFTSSADDKNQTWRAIQADCTAITARLDILSAPLWPTPDIPFDQDWRDIKTSETAPEWSFWTKWYDDALAGNPPNWEMLEQIALIESKVWGSGAVAVAGRISLIVETFDTLASSLEYQPTPQQALVQNAKVIRLQLDTLLLFVDEEIQRLRGTNDLSDDAMSRITLLEGIAVSVRAMLPALSGDASAGESALTVIDKNLPMVIDTAEVLAQQDASPEVSETIVMMGASIKHLTDCGAPGTLATRIAAVDVVWSAIRGWFARPKR